MLTIASGRNSAGNFLYLFYVEKKVPVPGKRISVRTLDLNMDFEKIKEQLDKIAEEHFGEAV